MTDRGKMPRGRTEVPVENGKYTVVIDHRPGMEGVAILRCDEPWVGNREIAGTKAIIAMACELERCRDLLHRIYRDSVVAESPVAEGHVTRQEIREALPRDYRPAVYVREDDSSEKRCNGYFDDGVMPRACAADAGCERQGCPYLNSRR